VRALLSFDALVAAWPLPRGPAVSAGFPGRLPARWTRHGTRSGKRQEACVWFGLALYFLT